MSNNLRIGLLFASLFSLTLVSFSISKKKLNIKYSIVWFLWSLLSLFMVIFPEAFSYITKLIGIALPVNGVFLIMIGLLYGLTFYSYIMISKHNDEIIQLTYEVSSLKKEIENLKKHER